ncbi:hypothetical protein [Pseudoalteromonas sp. MEBiC 03485]|uniref:hypothetical protein n=1 Tax=Pseudoalteromonas sp. MEBiC 03485 TaxID=2571103 RepID=UPI0010F0D133|nr:hypothetical protein [Pseudoalteromonas sp. MEBiC 03485]RZD19601.1 hypothetical protein EVU92_20585 [Pseudoalteromonas sp. MEBiC 03485]
MDLSVLNCLGENLDFCAQSWSMHKSSFLFFFFDVIVWTFVHVFAVRASYLTFLLLNKFPYFRTLTSKVILLPSLLMFAIHITIPLVLLVIGLYASPVALWEWYFALYEKIPLLGEQSLLTSYFGL